MVAKGDDDPPLHQVLDELHCAGELRCKRHEDDRALRPFIVDVELRGSHRMAVELRVRAARLVVSIDGRAVQVDADHRAGGPTSDCFSKEGEVLPVPILRCRNHRGQEAACPVGTPNFDSPAGFRIVEVRLCEIDNLLVRGSNPVDLQIELALDRKCRSQGTPSF